MNGYSAAWVWVSFVFGKVGVLLGCRRYGDFGFRRGLAVFGYSGWLKGLEFWGLGRVSRAIGSCKRFAAQKGVETHACTWYGVEIDRYHI